MSDERLEAAMAGLRCLGSGRHYRASEQPVDQGPFAADGRCSTFKPRCPQREVRFGNRGLSAPHALYETFVGEGALRIDGFDVASHGGDRFTIVAQSNRGELKSEIVADRLVRLGQDRENERLFKPHQSAFSHRGRIDERQVVYGGGGATVQDLECWTEADTFPFRLLQDRRLTANVRCK